MRALLLTSKKLPQIFDKELGKIDLRLTEYRVLQQLSESGPTPMAKFSNEMLVTKAAITAITDEMERKGLVRRVRDSGDRRIVKVEMTPAGKKLFTLAKNRHDAVVTKLVSLLDPNEIRGVLRSYEKLNKFADEEAR